MSLPKPKGPAVTSGFVRGRQTHRQATWLLLLAQKKMAMERPSRALVRYSVSHNTISIRINTLVSQTAISNFRCRYKRKHCKAQMCVPLCSRSSWNLTIHAHEYELILCLCPIWFTSVVSMQGLTNLSWIKLKSGTGCANAIYSKSMAITWLSIGAYSVLQVAVL